MSQIIAIDAAFDQIFDDFSRLLPLINKKDRAVKHIKKLFVEAVRAYTMQQCRFLETADLLIDTLKPGYDLLVFAENPTARLKFLKQSTIPNHPLKSLIEPLVQVWQLEGGNHD